MAIELSVFLQRIGHRLITRMHSERQLARSLHGMAAPLTARMVVFEALAVNAGSALTPIGNP
jgi:predicted cation transporter